MAKVLIIDDEQSIRSSLKDALQRRGHHVVTAENITTGREYLAGGFDLLLLDVKLPDGNGVEFLRELRKADADSPDQPYQPVVMISGHADINDAVQAIKYGALDFIEKPLSLDRILLTIDNATRTARLRNETKRLSKKIYGEMIGNSEVIEKVRNDIKIAAARTDKFLILGENGTGKELAAHLIHSSGRNSEGPFVAVNCAALPSELIEAELFGHTAGAYTGATARRNGRFQEAEGGTIFLDEISEMSAESQSKILRTLEGKTVTPVGGDKEVAVDCLVIAASNRDLEKEISKGNFRQDLFYRLNVVTIIIPPLRERVDDIELLAQHFLNLFATESAKNPPQLNKEALHLLKLYPFPGNIRELRNLMERLSIYTEQSIITADDIKAQLPGIVLQNDSRILKDAVEQFEREFIAVSLRRNNHNVSETARELGLERSHLYKKMKKIGLEQDS